MSKRSAPTSTVSESAPALGEATVLHGNALDTGLPERSMDLIVTSPPYFSLRSYKDQGEHYDGQIGDEPTANDFVDALVRATAEMARVLKDTGSIWVNLGDKYATNGSLMGLPWRYANRVVDDLDLVLRAEMIWAKPNGLPDTAKNRVGRKHEQWFHFTKHKSAYYADLDEIREPYAQPDRVRSDVFGGRSSALGVRHAGAGVYTGPTHAKGKRPGSVWTVAVEPLRLPEELGVDHFAAFPSEFPRRIILGWSPPGGTVLDPFGGTGTTAAVARALGRHGTSLDLSRDYVRVATWRVTDPTLADKVRTKSWPAGSP